MSSTTKIAVIQAAPSFLNKDKTIQKIIRLSVEAGRKGARLIVFPEAFLPGYPRGFTFGVHVGNRTEQGRILWQRYYENALDVNGPDLSRIGEVARKINAFISLGVVEKEGGTLFCSNFFFGPEGTLLGKHRKLKPTAAERFIWGEGDGSTLTTLDTEMGILGSLICWENYMPLARMAMYNKGIQIYIAPTADQRESWQWTMRHIAIEGRCFVLSCNQYINTDFIPEDILQLEDIKDPAGFVCRGGSVVVAPSGELLAGPLWDREGILYADLDLGAVARGKFDLDVSGHYNRPDVFKFEVAGQPPVLKIPSKSKPSEKG